MTSATSLRRSLRSPELSAGGMMSAFRPKPVIDGTFVHCCGVTEGSPLNSLSMIERAVTTLGWVKRPRDCA